MREGSRGSRVRKVVRRNVNRLHGGDRAFHGRSDSLLEFPEVGRESRLITDSGRRSSEKSRHLGTRLGETENVVDEKKDVLTLGVAEILGERKRRKGNPGSRSRRLVHLSEYESRVSKNPRFLHLPVKVVSFPGSLSHSAENRVTAVFLGYVMDEFHQQNGLSYSRSAEKTDFPALKKRSKKIDNLYARLEKLHLGALLDEFGCGTVNGPALLSLYGAGFIYRFSDHVKQSPESFLADGDCYSIAGVKGILPPFESLG